MDVRVGGQCHNCQYSRPIRRRILIPLWLCGERSKHHGEYPSTPGPVVGNPLTGSPFASTAVLAAFAGKDRSTVNQRLLHWVPLAYPQWEASSFAALDTGAFDTIWTTIGAKSHLEPFFWEKLHNWVPLR